MNGEGITETGATRSAATLVTSAVAACIGRSVTYHAPEPLTASSIRYFAIAIGSDPARWTTEAPPTLICETAQLTGRAEADAHGYLGHTWSLPFPRPVVMIRGGNDYRFERPVRANDLLVTNWTILDITERVDRAGSTMAVVISRATYETSAGELLATNTETLLYRPVAA